MSIRYWLVVQPLDRARLLVEGGYVQVPWGRPEPVQQMAEADGVAIYAPRAQNPDGEPLRAFVQAGRIVAGEAYASRGQWRREVDWLAQAQPAAVRPLRDLLGFTRSKWWGEQLRAGWLEIDRRDFEIIEDAVRRPAPDPSRYVLDLLRQQSQQDEP